MQQPRSLGGYTFSIMTAPQPHPCILKRVSSTLGDGRHLGPRGCMRAVTWALGNPNFWPGHGWCFYYRHPPRAAAGLGPQMESPQLSADGKAC